MEKETGGTEWTGLAGKFGAWFLASPWRRWSEVFTGRSREALMQEVSSRLRGDEVVLDAGCGSGYLSLPIARRLPAGRVLGLDLSEEMLGALEKRASRAGLSGRVERLQAPADASGLKDASVDWVVCNNVLHELPDPRGALEEWARVLKPGGRVALSDFRATRPFKLFMSLRHGEGAHGPFSTEGLAELLGQVGLEEVRVTPYRHTLLGVATRV